MTPEARTAVMMTVRGEMVEVARKMAHSINSLAALNSRLWSTCDVRHWYVESQCVTLLLFLPIQGSCSDPRFLFLPSSDKVGRNLELLVTKFDGLFLAAVVHDGPHPDDRHYAASRSSPRMSCLLKLLPTHLVSCITFPSSPQPKTLLPLPATSCCSQLTPLPCFWLYYDVA